MVCTCAEELQASGWPGGRLFGREEMSTLTRLAVVALLGCSRVAPRARPHGVDTLHRILAGFLPPAVNTEGVGGLQPVRELHRVLNEQRLWIIGSDQVHSILLKLCFLKSQ